jgi:hypothetical protein
MSKQEDKIDEVVLALLQLTLHEGNRAWKGFDWSVLDRLHAKGFITNPKGKAKSVELTEQGLAKSRALFESHFGPGE